MFNLPQDCENGSKRSQRLECNGIAYLRLLAPERTQMLKVRGKVLDLSLLGCYIETERPLSVRVGDRLEVYFELNGLPILLMGITRAIHDENQFDIEFVDVSSRKREDLKFLLDELMEDLPQKGT